MSFDTRPSPSIDPPSHLTTDMDVQTASKDILEADKQPSGEELSHLTNPSLSSIESTHHDLSSLSPSVSKASTADTSASMGYGSEGLGQMRSKSMANLKQVVLVQAQTQTRPQPEAAEEGYEEELLVSPIRESNSTPTPTPNPFPHRQPTTSSSSAPTSRDSSRTRASATLMNKSYNASSGALSRSDLAHANPTPKTPGKKSGLKSFFKKHFTGSSSSSASSNQPLPALTRSATSPSPTPPPAQTHATMEDTFRGFVMPKAREVEELRKEKVNESAGEVKDTRPVFSRGQSLPNGAGTSKSAVAPHSGFLQPPTRTAPAAAAARPQAHPTTLPPLPSDIPLPPSPQPDNDLPDLAPSSCGKSEFGESTEAAEWLETPITQGECASSLFAGGVRAGTPTSLGGRRRLSVADESEEERREEEDEDEGGELVLMKRKSRSKKLSPIVTQSPWSATPTAFSTSPPRLPADSPDPPSIPRNLSLTSSTATEMVRSSSVPDSDSRTVREEDEGLEMPPIPTVRSSSVPRKTARERGPPPVAGAGARYASGTGLVRKPSKFRQSVYELADVLTGESKRSPTKPMPKRMSISPTIHTLGSIRREADEIMDAEEKERAESFYMF